MANLSFPSPYLLILTLLLLFFLIYISPLNHNRLTLHPSPPTNHEIPTQFPPAPSPVDANSPTSTAAANSVSNRVKVHNSMFCYKALWFGFVTKLYDLVFWFIIICINGFFFFIKKKFISTIIYQNIFTLQILLKTIWHRYIYIYIWFLLGTFVWVEEE